MTISANDPKMLSITFNISISLEAPQIDTLNRSIDQYCNLFVLPTTCRYPNCVFAVTVLIWHIYRPLSSSCTLLICKNHVLCLSWVTLMRGFLVITWLWTVKIADCSKCIHATWKQKKNNQINSRCTLE